MRTKVELQGGKTGVTVGIELVPGEVGDYDGLDETRAKEKTVCRIVFS